MNSGLFSFLQDLLFYSLQEAYKLGQTLICRRICKRISRKLDNATGAFVPLTHQGHKDRQVIFESTATLDM